MSDLLIKRLRIGQNAGSRVCEEAADALEAKDAEIERLRAELRDIEQKGHSEYHGRGFSLANIAEAALDTVDEKGQESK